MAKTLLRMSKFSGHEVGNDMTEMRLRSKREKAKSDENVDLNEPKKKRVSLSLKNRSCNRFVSASEESLKSMSS